MKKVGGMHVVIKSSADMNHGMNHRMKEMVDQKGIYHIHSDTN